MEFIIDENSIYEYITEYGELNSINCFSYQVIGEYTTFVNKVRHNDTFAKFNLLTIKNLKFVSIKLDSYKDKNIYDEIENVKNSILKQIELEKQRNNMTLTNNITSQTKDNKPLNDKNESFGKDNLVKSPSINAFNQVEKKSNIDDLTPYDDENEITEKLSSLNNNDDFDINDIDIFDSNDDFNDINLDSNSSGQDGDINLDDFDIDIDIDDTDTSTLGGFFDDIDNDNDNDGFFDEALDNNESNNKLEKNSIEELKEKMMKRTVSNTSSTSYDKRNEEAEKHEYLTVLLKEYLSKTNVQFNVNGFKNYINECLPNARVSNDDINILVTQLIQSRGISYNKFYNEAQYKKIDKRSRSIHLNYSKDISQTYNYLINTYPDLSSITIIDLAIYLLKNNH